MVRIVNFSSDKPLDFHDTIFSVSPDLFKVSASLLLARFTCLSLTANFSHVNLLNYWVVIYLSWSWSVVLALLTVGILFLTTIRAAVLAKLVILGAFFTFVYFSIESSIYSKISIIRYFIFNILDLSIIYIFFNKIIFYCIT